MMEEQRKQFDVCIVCALYEEASAVIDEFQARCNVSFTSAISRLERYEYRWATIQNNCEEALTVLVSWLSASGPVRTGLDLKPLLQEFRPRFAAMTGFCAGYKGKVRLGDLVIAEYAYHYEEGKILGAADGQKQHQPEMQTVHPTTQMVQYAKGFNGWEEPVSELKQHLLRNSTPTGRHIAPMASGMAVRADNPFPWLAEYQNRKTIALDMEAASFYLTLRAYPHTHALVIKGVSDYADMQKHDKYHDYAARASAVYMLIFIQKYVTEQVMPSASGRIDRKALLQLEQIIQNFKSLGGQIADYAHLRGEKGFNVEVCESRYNLLYEEAIVFLATYLPERVADDAEGFAQTVHRRSIVELQQRSDLFVSFTRWVISPLAKLEKLGALVNACTATLE